jgi:2-haloacid dehalogenase
MSSPVRDRPEVVVLDIGNVLIGWDPLPAVAAGVGAEEAARFLAADDFDFMAWNHRQDAGRTWDEAEAEVARTHPHWAPHARSYRGNFDLSLVGAIEHNVAVLRDLAAAAVPVVGLTNWSAELFPHARHRFDFLALFDDVVVSGEEGVAKPDPAIFEVLRRRIGPPLELAVFADDSPANVAAGARAGLDTVLCSPGTDLRHELRRRGLPV